MGETREIRFGSGDYISDPTAVNGFPRGVGALIERNMRTPGKVWGEGRDDLIFLRLSK